MAITYVGAGAVVYSTSNPSPAAPTHAVGDLLIAIVGTKPDTTPATLPAGWTLLGAASGGAGTTGIDTGPMRFGIFYKYATSTTDTTGAITVTGNNVSAAQVFAYRCSATNTFDVAFTGAADSSAGTAFTATMPVNPGLTVGDELLAVGVIPTDVGAAAQFTAETVSAAGMTTVNLTELVEWSSSTGQDMGGWIARGPVVTGTATAPPTVSSTANGTTTNVTGPIGLVRLREIPLNYSLSTSDTGSLSASEASSLVQVLAKTATDTGTISATETSSKYIPPPVAFQQIKNAPYYFSSKSNVSATLDSAPPMGDLLVAVATFDARPQATCTITDNTGGVWVRGQSIDNNNSQTLTFWYCLNANGGSTTVTASFDIPVGFLQFTVLHYSGSYVAGPSNGLATDNLYYWSSGPITTTSPALLVATSVDTPGGQVPNFDGSFVSRFSDGGTNLDLDLLVGDLQQQNAGTISSDFTAIGVPQASTAIIHSFVPAVQAPAPTAVTGVDSGSISATEVSSLAGASSSVDSGAFSAIETRAISSTSASVDSGSISATDSSTVFVTLSANDTGTLSASDASSVTVLVSVNDSGAFSASEVSGSLVTSVRTDTGSLSAIESVGLSSSSNSVDTGNLSATETTAIASVLPSNDTGAISATETASTLVIISTSDTGTLSATEGRSGSVTGSANDTGALSATETSALAVSFASTDAGTLSGTESSSVSITGTFSVSGNDTGTLSATDSSSLAITNAVSANDTGSLSATDASSVFKSITASDTGTFSATDVSDLFKTITASDTGSISATENANVFNDRPATDSGSLFATETSSVLISGLVTKSANDAGSLSALDTSQPKILVAVADAGTFSATDTSLVFKALSSTDTGTLSATEARSLLVSLKAVDTGVFSAIETAAYSEFVGLQVNLWDGTKFVTGELLVWNGTAFVTPVVMRWNGTSFDSAS